MTDANGTTLLVGDLVTIDATITSFSGDQDTGCNVTLQTLLPAHGDGSQATLSSLNTGQLVLQLRPAGATTTGRRK